MTDEINLKTFEGGLISMDGGGQIIIPIYYNNKNLDIEGMQDAFNECLNILINNEKKILKELK